MLASGSGPNRSLKVIHGTRNIGGKIAHFGRCGAGRVDRNIHTFGLLVAQFKLPATNVPFGAGRHALKT